MLSYDVRWNYCGAKVSSMRITFANHHGILNIDDDTVQFYKLEFVNITQASKLLRHSVAGPKYVGWVDGDNYGLYMISSDETHSDSHSGAL